MEIDLSIRPENRDDADFKIELQLSLCSATCVYAAVWAEGSRRGWHLFSRHSRNLFQFILSENRFGRIKVLQVVIYHDTFAVRCV